MNLQNKILIGTANFGMKYGIMNGKKLSDRSIQSILHTATDNYIWGIDTASGYKDSEETLGKYISNLPLEIVTKLPNKSYTDAQEVIDEVNISLQKLNRQKVHTILIHNFNNYQKDKKSIMSAFDYLLNKKIITYWGISTYHVQDVERLFRDGYTNFAVEFPFNLLDRRFIDRSIIRKMKKNKCFLIARSVFLQGLLIKDPKKLTYNFKSIKGRLSILNKLARQHNIPVPSLVLLFVLTQDVIDKVVIGVDSAEQLKKNLDSVMHIEQYNKMKQSFAGFEVTDENIILPYKWNTKKRI